jgi:hypothetical protein
VQHIVSHARQESVNIFKVKKHV